MEQEKQGLIDIGRLVFAFAKVKRITLYDDGVTPESDTDHTVMLSMCACALAARLYPHLDLGKVAQYAIVHDLVEAYAGDTNSINISDETLKNKEQREREALERIVAKFDTVYPWISKTIQEYEALDTDEAQFVKTVDKIMTKLTHRLNGGAYMKRENMTKQEFTRHYESQAEKLEVKYGSKFPEVISILKQLTDDIVKEVYV